MTIRVALNHNTYYTFDKPVELYPHIIRLRPAPHARVPIKGYSLRISPENHFINWQQDPFGNFQARVVFPEKSDHLHIEVEAIVDMVTVNPFDFFIEEAAEHYPFRYEKKLKAELAPYLKVKERGKKLTAWLKKNTPKVNKKNPMRTIDFLVALNQKVQHSVGYHLRMEPGVQSCDETLTLKTGSCRDSAWLLVQVLRHLGLAARFASGYLVQLTSDIKSLDGPSGPEEDFTDLHAWCEVYLPGAGWIGLDPTSGLMTGEGHIPLACTPESDTAAPITGATGKCEVEFEFSNTVTRIHEDPRVTKPYSDAQWQSIDALGEKVDKVLDRVDARLTIGGEPTFVSIDDMESAQWNTDAIGEHKLSLAKDLLKRMSESFADGALLHYGQGKWYPGEPIPRWALGCYWRKDGEALWHDPAFLADVDTDYDADIESAEAFVKGLLKALKVPSHYLIEAFEDAAHYVQAEQALPDNVNLYEHDLSDDLERARLARILTQGLNKPSGFVVPLKWDTVNEYWRSCSWPLRAKRLITIPGDTPLGFRLPLDSLPWVSEQEAYQPERDPLEKRADTLSAVEPKTVDKHTGTVIKTALVVEPRQGRLHVFLPPTTHIEHYMGLLQAVEAMAKAQAMPVVIEGYEPPHDPRIQQFKVTPDPGVIEVNIHPSQSWRELVDKTTTLYDLAYQCRLGTEKFMIDGRHTGTGGGNHVTLGGITAADSPMLRKPELLQSLITYWQHHPSLSYLFSGMFIGPTSQAPRVDEGRDDVLYELEIAFAQIPEGETVEPWLVDRIFRNLLVDITGNTHRAEFCIDKLYSPSGPMGRLGILEFRGFEMPPHARMALVQNLLLRTLIARFWDKPYKHPLVRWGTELHDRFMLPHYIEQDINDVVNDLNQHGYAFKAEWFEPFIEFRFPFYGKVDIDNIHLEVRWAIEPWHVLGEEVGAQGTTRYVDSSVERLQVKLSGITEGRHILTCNGKKVPLRATGVSGEQVAGIRYRAWQPPSALHPTLGVDTPLVFDLVDTWNNTIIGGCTYHVSHPGGLSYDTLPVNVYEADSRRENRFWDFGHTPTSQAYQNESIIRPPNSRAGARELKPSTLQPRPVSDHLIFDEAKEYGYTLDLRKKR